MLVVTSKFFNYFLTALLVVIIVIPRIFLLQNGLDHQRIWDTNTPDAFRLLESVQKNDIKGFYFQDHKYPLLGSYFYIPTIILYYGVEKIIGNYQSPQDFVRDYALDETSLFFWIRLESVFINILALVFLYFLTRNFTNDSKKAGFYTVLFASVNYIITLFSVTPRIHNYVFASTVVAMYFSFRLVKNKNVSDYLLAFGASAISASISQSGFVNFLLPVLAHFYDNKWNMADYRFYFKKNFLVGIFLGIFMVTLFGYPHILLSVFNLSDGIFGSILSKEHAIPTFDITNLFIFLKRHFLNTGMFFGWGITILLYQCWYYRKIKFLNFEIYDFLSFAQILFFLIVFGTSDVATERFTLVILPAEFFIFSRIFVRLQDKKWIICSAIITLCLQGYGLMNLTRIANNIDTREQALNYILYDIDVKDKVLGSVDGGTLGVVQTPDMLMISDNKDGIKNKLIIDQYVLNSKSRNYVYWNMKQKNVDTADLSDFSYIVLSSDSVDGILEMEQKLSKQGFSFVRSFAAKKDDVYSMEFIPWDIVTPQPNVFLPLKLREFRAIGQSIFIYKRNPV